MFEKLRSLSFPSIGDIKIPSFVTRNLFLLQKCLISDMASGCFDFEIAFREKAYQLLNHSSNPSFFNVIDIIRVCANGGLFSHAQHIHCFIVKSGFDSNVFVSTALIQLFVKFDRINDAHHLFVQIPEPNVGSWNSLISGYARNGQFRTALKLFIQLENSHVSADSYSFTAALSACANLSLVRTGELVHSKIVKCGVDCSVFVANCLVNMYGKCGLVSEAMRVFGEIFEKDTISWNSAIAANARNGRLEQAFSIMLQMPDPDTISYNELIDGIARYGNIEHAISLLSKMRNPNSSSWNSIITGYVNRGRGREAMVFFCRMHSSGFRMDEFTFSSILSGIARLSAVTWGTLLHCCALKFGLEGYVVVGSALIDMYSKCGQIEEAERLFQFLPEKNLVTWNAMISGYACNGSFKMVIHLFEKLTRITNLQPDEISFLNLLSACCHGRIPLKIANRFFETMISVYSIHPTPEHCSLMITLMGRERRVEEAKKMIEELGYGSCGLVWKALLGACVTSAAVEVAEVAAAKIIELENDSDFVYVTMSKIYASHGKWDSVFGIREMMKGKRVRKEAGCSWIE